MRAGLVRAARAAVVLPLLACFTGQPSAGAPSDASLESDTPGFGFIDPLDDVDATPSSRVRRILGGTCAGVGNDTNCHSRSAGGLTMNLALDGGDVINVLSLERPDLFRVKPGSPGESYLYLKVLGDGGIDGGRMPLNQLTFDPRLPALIATWIEAGAPVN